MQAMHSKSCLEKKGQKIYIHMIFLVTTCLIIYSAVGYDIIYSTSRLIHNQTGVPYIIHVYPHQSRPSQHLCVCVCVCANACVCGPRVRCVCASGACVCAVFVCTPICVFLVYWWMSVLTSNCMTYSGLFLPLPMCRGNDEAIDLAFSPQLGPVGVTYEGPKES